jgi:hypothetical protein
MTLIEPIGKFKAVSFMKFTNGLVSKIELFYDPRIFEDKKDEIFSKK